MSEKETKVTKQETLAALRNPGELYVIMSAATKMPFVKCDEETFDDEIFLYYQMEDAKDKARKLLDEKYVSAVAKLAKEQLLPFHKSLYNGSKRTGGQQRNRYGNYSSAFRSGNEKYTEGTSGRKADRGKPGAPSDGGLFYAGT